MKPDISEFSYGYALTSEIVQKCGTSLTGAPVFPSLIDEGSLGYDLELPIAGRPVFIQFKLCDYMVRSTAEGADKVSIPHYRMHLRPLKHSQQHDLLLALEKKGRTVLYAAPEFHRPNELNEAYAKKEIMQRSAFFRPQSIGTLPDDEEHFVCFNAGASHGYRCSEPVEVKKVQSEAVVEILASQSVDSIAAQLSARAYLQRLADELVAEWREWAASPKRRGTLRTEGGEVFARIVDSGEHIEQETVKLLAEIRQARGSREYLGWVAQALFDCAVFVRLRPKNVQRVV